jgi:hypothetical protein
MQVADMKGIEFLQIVVAQRERGGARHTYQVL